MSETTYTYEGEIGEYLAFDAKEGDHVTVHCRSGMASCTIVDIPNQHPAMEGQQAELIGKIDGVNDSEQSIGLYASVMKMKEMGIDYDLYAIHMYDSAESDSLGEIQKLEVTRNE